MSYATAGARAYCPKCGDRIGEGAMSLHLPACDGQSWADEWQGMVTAPRDGTEILAQAKNMGGAWMEPGLVWWAQNTAVEDPVFPQFWAHARDSRGHPISCYHEPLRWQPLKSAG